uniref:Myosin XVB n=1 Tax=Gopherus agassizii TaxID=38772 RepID=A0A452H2J7_9SAUR
MSAGSGSEQLGATVHQRCKRASPTFLQPDSRCPGRGKIEPSPLGGEWHTCSMCLSPAQATDHTFLQKCHYHHGNNPWYGKPKLPSPVFTVQHYAGPVTYQVHKFLNKNHDQLHPEVLEIFSRSYLKVQYSFRVMEWQFLLVHLSICPFPLPHPPQLSSPHGVTSQLSDVFDVEYVTCQLRHSGILEAIHIRKEGYPIHIPFQHFLEPNFPALGQPLQQPLTRLEGKDMQSALEINKLILRFVGDRNLQSWQEVLLGNYIASRGLGNPALRNEILSQVVSQVWKNPDTEQSQRGYDLMAALLSAFTPSPALEKPLLKFVSDHGLEGYNAVCQRKILTAMQQTDMDPEVSRAHPPTLLEWTANQRRGKMVLDVFTYNEETFSAEVESWTTGEQYAGWILSSRGLDKEPRGWSVSMLTGEVWQDLPGCDFMLDLIGEMEEAGHPSLSSADYPITPEWEGSPSWSTSLDIDGKPHCMSPSSIHIGSANGSRSAWGAAWGRKHFPTWESLSVTVALVASFHLGYPGMMQVPAYQPMPMMGGMMPAPMPMMPAPMPGNKMQKWPTPAPPSPPPAPKQKVQEKKAKKEPRPVVAADLAPKREPSREIHNIIKMYQSRPAPEPQPIVPVRPSKSFLKKSDPKNEALAKLGMASPQPPKSSPRGAPPPPPTKKGQTATSIREKQQPLMHLFGQQPTSPVASLIPPPPPFLPPPLPPADQATQQSEPKGERGPSIPQLSPSLTASVSFSYASTPWKIFLRKEVFYPKETFSHPYCLNLLCEQIMQDTYSESCVRISKEERRKMKDLLGNRWLDATSILEDGIKKRIVVAARDNWANYFSRLFPVKGERGSDVQLLGVSHRGIRLLKMAKAASFSPEYLKILCSYSFADVLSVELKGSSSLEFSLKNEQLILHSAKARQVKAMVELFLRELKQDSNYVIALRSYVTDDKSLLSFKKGDLIQLLPMQGLEPGWQFGSIGGRSGLFPSSMVQLAAAPDYFSTHMNRQERLQKSLKRDHLETSVSREVRPPVGWGRHGWALEWLSKEGIQKGGGKNLGEGSCQ